MMGKVVLPVLLVCCALCARAGIVVERPVEEDMYDQTDYITFEANGGVGEMDVKRVHAPCWVKLPKCRFTREGYVFAGWCGGCDDCEEGGDCWSRAGEKVWVRGDKTFRATWTKLWIPHATNYCAYVRDASGAVGALVLVKAGRPGSKTGASALTATILQPRAAKFTLKGRTDDGEATLEGRANTLVLHMDESSLTGTLNGYAVTGAPIPGDIVGDYLCDASEIDLSAADGAWTSLPTAVPVTARADFWLTPKKGKLMLEKGAFDDCRTGENPCGLKLKYNARNGTFSGSFTAYLGLGYDVSFVGGDRCTVKGVWVDGAGYGYAVSKVGNVYEVSVR